MMFELTVDVLDPGISRFQLYLGALITLIAILFTVIKAFLAERDSAPAVYPFLRQLFHQDHGPNITTLLAILPLDYLAGVRKIVAAHAREVAGAWRAEDDPDTRAAA